MEFSTAFFEADRRVLERPEVRAVAIEMIQEGVRQRAVGWVDEGIPQSQLRLYPGEGPIPILDRPIKGIVETLLTT